MRVLFLDHEPILSGAELMLLHFLRLCDRARFACELLVPREGPLVDEVRRAQVDVHVLPLDGDLLRVRRRASTFTLRRTYQLARGVRHLRRFIRGRAPDVIVSNSLKAHVYGSLALRDGRIPYGWRLHDVIDSRDFSAPQRTFLGFLARRYPASIAAVSKGTYESMITAGVSHARLRLLHNGVEMPGLVEDDVLERFRSAFGLTGDDIVISLPGRVVPEKGHRVFLEAARKVASSVASARFLIVGEPTYQEFGFKSELESYIRVHGLDRVVSFTGFQRDMSVVYAVSDVVVQPTLFTDPFPTVILEAMAAKKLVVASDAGGGREIITDGENGFIVPANDASSLAEKLIGILSNLPKYESMRQCARIKVASEYAMKTYVNAMESWLNDLLQRAQGR